MKLTLGEVIMKTHLSINVSSVEESIKFYSRMFGVEPVKVRPDYAKFDISNPPLNFTMNQTIFERGGSLSHLGLQVETTEEVLDMTQRWANSGLVTLEEMKTDCCYALQDKTWVEDPDGNRWEVFTVLENTEGKPNAASACCGPSAEAVTITRSENSLATTN
jgi:predicted enzyme related to lactoylglutathione lyase